jgi:hypothetical protein
MSQNLISKLPEDGFLYGAVDIPDGEYNADQINARVNAQSAQFSKVYANQAVEMPKDLVVEFHTE